MLQQPLPIFYINLATRPDRRAFIEGQLSRLALTAERVDAITIGSVPQHLIDLHAGSLLNYPVSTGDLACGLSHQAAWRLILERGFTSALILEDDALLTDPLLPFMRNDILERVDADLLKLETWGQRVLLGASAQGVGSVNLHELQSSHMGAAAYVISATAAAASLAHPDVNAMGIDRFLFGKGGPHLISSRIKQAVPSPAVQLDWQGNNTPGEAQSDIAAARRARPSDRRRPSAGRRLALNLRHAGRLVSLIIRDPGVVLRKRQSVPYAGD